MIIKHITKIEAKTPRFSLNYRPMLMPTRLVRGWEGKSVIWEVAKTQCTPVIYFLKYKTVLVEMPSITFDI